MSTTILQNVFLPTQIPGCQIWLDAADPSVVVKSGTTVTAWNDKSGNGYNLNTLPMNQYLGIGNAIYPSVGTAINKLSTIYFSPWAGLKQATVVNGAKNFYWVGRISSDSADSYFLMGADTTYDWHANGGVNTTILASAYAQAGLLAASPASQYTSGANAVVNTSFSNIVYPSAGDISLLSVAGITGNTRYQGVCFDRQDHTGWCGDLAEVVIYSTALTTAQHQQVEGYLAQKWGLQTSLPPNHPYRYSAYFTNQAYVSTIVSPTVTNRFNNASFNPASLPGCQLWFDAADRTSMTFSGSTVTQWNDKSGNGRNATNGGYVAPTYSATGFNGGYPGLLFNGSSSMLNTPALLPTPVLSSNGTDTTIFVVFNYTGRPVSGGFGLYGLGSQANAYVVRTPWNAGGDAGGAIIDTTSATLTSRIVAQFGSANPAQLYSIFRSGASHYFYQFGSLTASNLSSSGTVGTTSQTFGIGGGIADTIFFNSYISELIIYNVAITTDQRQQVEGYLAWKWGLVVNLPPTHPYKKTSAVFVTQPTTLAILQGNPLNSMMVSNRFNPTSIAGSVLWLDGKDTSSASMTLSGTTVITWKDKSGGAHNATSVNNPKLLSSGGVSFNGASSQYFTMAVPYTNTNTMFMVASPVASTTVNSYYFNTQNPNYCGAMFLGGYNNSYVCAFYPANPSVEGNPSQEPVLSASLPTNPFLVTSVKTAGVSAFGYYNGAQAYSQGDTATTGPSYWDFLGAAGVGYNYITANIYEIIFYNSALTTSQRQQIEGYLAWKWGLQGSLPATHPYKSFPPPP